MPCLAKGSPSLLPQNSSALVPSHSSC
jgi:hypothetical protein